MKIFKELEKLGYKHYGEYTVEELDELPSNSEDRMIEESRVLRWFINDKRINAQITTTYDEWDYYIPESEYNEIPIRHISDTWKYEDAVFECIKKLIILVKENQPNEFK